MPALGRTLGSTKETSLKRDELCRQMCKLCIDGRGRLNLFQIEDVKSMAREVARILQIPIAESDPSDDNLTVTMQDALGFLLCW
jgi:hypothetical protein